MLAYMDAGYTSEEPARDAEAYGMQLEAVPLSEAGLRAAVPAVGGRPGGFE